VDSQSLPRALYFKPSNCSAAGNETSRITNTDGPVLAIPLCNVPEADKVRIYDTLLKLNDSTSTGLDGSSWRNSVPDFDIGDFITSAEGVISETAGYPIDYPITSQVTDQNPLLSLSFQEMLTDTDRLDSEASLQANSYPTRYEQLPSSNGFDNRSVTQDQNTIRMNSLIINRGITLEDIIEAELKLTVPDSTLPSLQHPKSL
jgi:hypothetical protein